MIIGRDGPLISVSVFHTPHCSEPHSSQLQPHKPECAIDDLHNLIQQPVHHTVRGQRRRDSVRTAHRRQKLVNAGEEVARCGHDGGKHLCMCVGVGGQQDQKSRIKESRVKSQESDSDSRIRIQKQASRIRIRMGKERAEAAQHQKHPSGEQTCAKSTDQWARQKWSSTGNSANRTSGCRCDHAIRSENNQA